MYEGLICYFAYGSNMSPERMQKRCPGAVLLGPAKLPGFKVVERLYADIDYEPGEATNGILWLLRRNHLKRLDKSEGCPKIYRKICLEVIYQKSRCLAIIYMMTEASKAERNDKPYPPEYRQLCSDAAKFHKISNAFRRKSKCKK